MPLLRVDPEPLPRGEICEEEDVGIRNHGLTTAFVLLSNCGRLTTPLNRDARF